MASNGVQAISYLAKNKADLILLDYEMPVATDRRFFQCFKNDSEMKQIPLSTVTA